jgi:hypothetical protein
VLIHALLAASLLSVAAGYIRRRSDRSQKS